MASVDATRYRLQTASRWISPAWLDQLERILVDVREISTEKPGEIRAFAAQIAALPFVAEVGGAEVQWPDGLILPIRLHEPIACVPTGGRDFLPVADDGTVLDGYAFAPHEAYGGWLPTLGPHGAFRRPIEPGEVLELAAHLAGLSVADSMWKYLDAQDLRRLGRVFIDASAAEAPVFDRAPGSTTPRSLPGGVIIALEDGRRIYFGRPPEPVLDGELPISLKWRHVREALRDSAEAADAGADWALLDVRFDVPIRRTRAEVEEFVARGALERDAFGGGR